MNLENFRKTYFFHWFKAGGIGVGVSLFLFYIMSYLISGGKELGRSDDTGSFIEFIRLKKEDLVQERKRQLPPKTPKPKKPPPPKKMDTAADKPVKPKMQMNFSLIKGAIKGSGPSVGLGGMRGNSGLTPIVRIEPQYPRKAAMQGIEGWVRLRFDVTALGTVENVKVLDSRPRGIFDLAAKRALLKWKYKPRMDDGKAVPQPGEMVQLDFKLEE